MYIHIDMNSLSFNVIVMFVALVLILVGNQAEKALQKPLAEPAPLPPIHMMDKE